ncbi:two-component system, OmpR family, sensor kinase [Tessaracoccus bendigoensis DSM 12906]|uniref:histidine kinase n=1 Tax=Tessaracoccus bendigoensis DSM 12906 TaxID=1123357 RepID=A0A1M6C8M5_9ACTN|nr:HAMP domain-containing sensor histidine kinase [Tessaracoccus bendigoensis]SHI57114.1 two-component system, OmpR family, sensor kinase [Tessaracoccus bendigoensis DSM 12906]
MRRWSLRKRLVLGSVALMAVALFLASSASLALFATAQVRQLDERLISPFGARPPEQLRDWLDQACLEAPESARMASGYVMASYDQGGALLCQIPADQGAPDWTGIDRASLVEVAASQEVLTLQSTDHRDPPWRARAFSHEGGFLVVAYSLADIQVAAKRLAFISFTVSLITLAIAALAGLAMVRIGLRPLTEIERTADEIAAGNLTSRIDVAAPNTEVGHLATSLNAMLAQIESAFDERNRTEERLRRFVADASHELRTPLATIRGHAELVHTGVAKSPDDIARVIGRIESESIRMASLVEDLLVLARLDTAPTLDTRPVDLLSIAVDAVTGAQVRHPGRRITVSNPTEPPWEDMPATALGDPGRLHQVLTNLLSNAVRYTPSDTEIEVCVGVQDGRVRVSVIDHGPGLKAGNESRVFERFFREDQGRGRATGGAGLGLAIASALVEKHGGTLAYLPTPGGGSTFEISLPAVEI